LALKVEAGADDQSFEGNSMFTLFSINVTLTEEGYTKLEEVLEAIFSFLLLLKSTPIEEHEKCFMELKQIRDTSFKFREEKTSNENVEELAVNMKYYKPLDIIAGSDVFFEFDGALTSRLIEELNEGKFNLLLLTDKREKYEKTEKWFGTEYDEAGELLGGSVLLRSSTFFSPFRLTRILQEALEQSNPQPGLHPPSHQRLHLHQLPNLRRRFLDASRTSREDFLRRHLRMFLQTRRNFQAAPRLHLPLPGVAENCFFCSLHGAHVALLDDRQALHVGEALSGGLRGSWLSAVQRGEGDAAEAQRI
jgi:hypothetical protein